MRHTFYLLFLAAFYWRNFLLLADSGLSLQPALSRDQRRLSFILTQLDPDETCSLRVFGSRKPSVGTGDKLILSLNSAEPTLQVVAKRLKLLKRSSSRQARKLKLYFAAAQNCAATELISAASSVTLTRSPTGQLKTGNAWISQLRAKLVAAALKVTEAFPSLSFSQITDIQSAPSDPRLFVAERGGKIFSFNNSSDAASKTEVLDISSKITNAGDEQGLLGIAVHPKFQTNGYLFVDYSRKADGATIISRFKTKTGDPTKFDPASEFQILSVAQPFANHNGGQLAFGPDGFLYISLGDGGSGGDPNGNGQNKKALLGKILRIDVDRSSGSNNYAIPSNNPFAGNSEGFKEEIFAFGLRNPWRFSFDKKTAVIWAGDVGQNSREEVDIIEKGKNYGWNTMEGVACYQPSSGCDKTGLTLPIADYEHPLGESITGGYVYRGTKNPTLIGKYIYADFVTGLIWALDNSGSTAVVTQLFKTNLNISTFGQDQQGELYLADYSGGKIYTLR